MGIRITIKNKWLLWLENERIQLSRPDAPMHLALVGLITGFLAGGVIILFRLIVETTQDSILPGHGPDNYEALSTAEHFMLPVLGGLLLALLFFFLPRSKQ